MQFLSHEQKASLTSLCDYNAKNSEKWQTKKKTTIGVSSLKCHYNIWLTRRAVICWGKSTSYDGEDKHWREVTAELPWSKKHVLQVFMNINAKFMWKKIILLTCSSMFTRDTNRLKGIYFFYSLLICSDGLTKEISNTFEGFVKSLFTLKRYHSFMALFVHWFGHQELGESRVFFLLPVKYDLYVYLW